MGEKIAFIGHRIIFYNKIRNRLYKEAKRQIENGCKFFTMGTHGEFDTMALSVCRELRNIYKDVIIEVVITSFKTIEPIIVEDAIWGAEKYVPYSDVNTIMYDIEEEYFKKRIIESNKQMINKCDTLICYVNSNKNYSGARIAFNYAKKKGLRVINLYSDS